MEFGSKFVYKYSDSEEESVSEEEFETGIDAELPLELVAKSSSTDAGIVRDDRRFNLPSTSSRSVVHPSAMAARSAGGSTAESRSKKKHHKWLSADRSADHDAVRSRPTFSPAAKKWRRADTNVVAIKFDHLTKPSNMHTGDSIGCIRCGALMSHLSKLQETGDQQVWLCDFCGTPNSVDVLPGEIPTLPDVTYMISPAATTSGSSFSGTDESLVIFCVDISGSMCVSQEVQGKLNLRGSHADRYRSLNPTGENQWIPGQNRNVTYVTRLQGLQAAVDHQLEHLAKDHPDRRVALVTFNSEVTIIGDGKTTPIVIAGDKLSNHDELVRIGSDQATPANIKFTRAGLGKLVFDLEEGGQTALGPAILLAVTMASKAAGSKVIMCTDGLANIGLGSFDGLTDDQQYKSSSEFYSKLGETAKLSGVTVSVLTIAGTDCKLVDLGSVASATGGQVDIVDPLKLTEEFGNILANPIIATHVVATFIVHKGLYIRGEPEKTSCVVRDVGNVTKDSEVTFEYGIRRADKKETVYTDDTKKSDGEALTDGSGGAEAASSSASAFASAAGEPYVSTDLNDLPFQVKIRYTDIEGAVAMRVLTQTQPVTKNRRQAEQYLNLPVVGCHAAQQSSALALEGAYTPSRLNAFMYQRLVARNTSEEHYGLYCDNMMPLEEKIRAAQVKEAKSQGSTIAAYENNCDEDTDTRSSTSEGFGSKLSKFFRGQPSKTMRKKTCSDVLSKEIYQKKSISSNAFTPSSSEVRVRSVPPLIPRPVSTRRPPPLPPSPSQESVAVLNRAESQEAPELEPRAESQEAPALEPRAAKRDSYKEDHTE